MMKKYKKLLIEICVIVVVSFAFGIVYNLFAPKPLPFLREQKKIEIVSDSLLQIPVKHDTIQTNQFTGSEIPQKAKVEVAEKAKVETKGTKPIAKEEPKKPDKPIAQSEPAKLKTLTYEQLIKNLSKPEFVFIDARPMEEFTAGHIPKAVSIFAYESDQNVYFSKINALPRDKILVVYCDGGDCDASHKLSADIMSFGYKNVFLYSGGWEEYSKKKK